MTAGTVASIDSGADPHPLDPRTTVGRFRLVGIAALLILAVAALALAPWSRFDTVRADMEAATRNMAIVRGAAINEITSCFQGFCFEDDTSRWEAWGDFVRTAVGLTRTGIVLGLLAAGLVAGFLVRSGDRRSERRPLILAAAFGIFVFSPAIAVVAIGAGAAAIALGARFGGGTEAPATAEETEPSPWRRVLARGTRVAAGAGGRFALVTLPLLAIALAAGAYGIQHLDAGRVDSLLGAHPVGILIGAAIGLLLPWSRLLAIPVAAGGILIGMAPAAATALLVAAAVGGPFIRRNPPGSWMRVTATTAVIAIAAGGVGIGWAAAQDALSPMPTVTFDGETCTYRGPATLPARSTEFRVENRATFLGTGVSLGVILGRLPTGVTLDQFRADLAGLPAGGLPSYFTIAGEERFVFPGTGRPTLFVVHNPGTYAMVCASGGGGYVVREFSMFQPQGWYDEFRETFDHTVAPTTVEFIPPG